MDIESVRLRDFRPEDAERLAELADNWNVARNMVDIFPHPYTLADAAGWIRDAVHDGNTAFRRFAIEAGGEFVGGAGIHYGQGERRHSATIGYWLGEAFWGRGIGTRVVALLAEEAFRNAAILRVDAEVFGWNPASARVLEKNGFELEGRQRNGIVRGGEYTDALHFGLLRPSAP